MLIIWAVALLAIDLFAYYPYALLCILIAPLFLYPFTLYTYPLLTTFIAFSGYQLPPILFSISPLTNYHKSILPYTPLRTTPFTITINVLLPLVSSMGFGLFMTIATAFPFTCYRYTFSLCPLSAITILLAPYPLGKTLLFAILPYFFFHYSFTIPSQYFLYRCYIILYRPLYALFLFYSFPLLSGLWTPFPYFTIPLLLSVRSPLLVFTACLTALLRCFPFTPSLRYRYGYTTVFRLYRTPIICPMSPYSSLLLVFPLYPHKR